MLLVDEYGDTAYTVGVPFMYDADYNVSYNVAVTVEQAGSVCRSPMRLTGSGSTPPSAYTPSCSTRR